MDKDKLITFLTSEDEEIRKVGLEIIKNNFDCNFTIYGGVRQYDRQFTYSLQKDDMFSSSIIKENVYTALKRTVEREDPFQFYFTKNIIDFIIEYNNEHRQNKGIATI